MYAIVYYNEKIQNDVIVYASSVYDICYKEFIRKGYDKMEKYRITIL